MEFLKDSVDFFVFGILGLMGFITVWLTAERLIFLRTLDPKEYDTQDSYDKALTDHLTTLYIRRTRTTRRSPTISQRSTSFIPTHPMWGCSGPCSAS